MFRSLFRFLLDKFGMHINAYVNMHETRSVCVISSLWLCVLIDLEPLEGFC